MSFCKDKSGPELQLWLFCSVVRFALFQKSLSTYQDVSWLNLTWVKASIWFHLWFHLRVNKSKMRYLVPGCAFDTTEVVEDVVSSVTDSMARNGFHERTNLFNLLCSHSLNSSNTQKEFASQNWPLLMEQWQKRAGNFSYIPGTTGKMGRLGEVVNKVSDRLERAGYNALTNRRASWSRRGTG